MKLSEINPFKKPLNADFIDEPQVIPAHIGDENEDPSDFSIEQRVQIVKNLLSEAISILDNSGSWIKMSESKRHQERLKRRHLKNPNWRKRIG